MTIRSTAEINDLFVGFEIVDAGSGPIAQWRPGETLRPGAERIWLDGGGILPGP